MSLTIFYSWQADREPKTTRSFIKTALDKAVRRIKQDLALDEAPRVDQDTRGEPGSPHIVDTILKKIDDCAIFVCDVTFVAESDKGDGIPNPNVLTERGYALKAVGNERIISVMNEAYGTPDKLPFDFRHIRWPMRYRLEPNTSTDKKKTVRDQLANELFNAIKSVLESGALEQSGIKTFTGAVAELLEYLIRTSEGSSLDYFGIESLRTKFSHVDEKELDEALYELQHHDFVELSYSMAGIRTVTPTLNLFVSRDRTVMKYDTITDAKALAAKVLIGDESWSVSGLHEMVDWEKRRFNPAVWYLLQFIDDGRISRAGAASEGYPARSFHVLGEDRQQLKSFVNE